MKFVISKNLLWDHHIKFNFLHFGREIFEIRPGAPAQQRFCENYYFRKNIDKLNNVKLL